MSAKFTVRDVVGFGIAGVGFLAASMWYFVSLEVDMGVLGCSSGPRSPQWFRLASLSQLPPYNLYAALKRRSEVSTAIEIRRDQRK